MVENSRSLSLSSQKLSGGSSLPLFYYLLFFSPISKKSAVDGILIILFAPEYGFSAIVLFTHHFLTFFIPLQTSHSIKTPRMEKRKEIPKTQNPSHRQSFPSRAPLQASHPVGTAKDRFLSLLLGIIEFFLFSPCRVFL